jgi:hypothetical protein
MEDRQQTFELVHLDLEHLELVYENFLEPYLHQVLENTVCVLLVAGFDVEIACQIVHALTVRNIGVVVCIGTQQRVQNRWVEGLAVQVERTVDVKGDYLLHGRRHTVLGHFLLHLDVVNPLVNWDQPDPLLLRRDVQSC